MSKPRDKKKIPIPATGVPSLKSALDDIYKQLDHEFSRSAIVGEALEAWIWENYPAVAKKRNLKK